MPPISLNMALAANIPITDAMLDLVEALFVWVMPRLFVISLAMLVLSFLGYALEKTGWWARIVRRITLLELEVVRPFFGRPLKPWERDR